MAKILKKPNFLDDMFGWPVAEGDIVNLLDEASGDCVPARVTKLKSGEVEPSSFSSSGMLEALTLNDDGEEDSESRKIEAFSKSCILTFGHPDNENVWRRKEFNEEMKKTLESFRARHGILE